MADNHNVNARLVSIHRDVLSQLGVTTDNSGTVTNSTITALTDGSQETKLVDEQGNFLYPSGYPQTMEEEITRPANVTAYAAFDNIAANVAVKQKETISFTGTGGTANVTGAGGLTSLATFREDLTTTAIDFESAYGAAYGLAGITLTRNMGDIILEATVAGVPFTAPVVTNVTTNLGGTVAHTTANVSLTPIEFTGMAISANGGGFIMGVKIETNMPGFAEKNLRLYLYDSQQTTLIDDNAAYVNKYADVRKLIGFIDVTMESLLTGSDSVVGQASTMMQYNADVYSIFAGLITAEAITPTSGGKLTITLYVLEIA